MGLKHRDDLERRDEPGLRGSSPQRGRATGARAQDDSEPEQVLREAAERAAQLARSGTRCLLGIVGLPGGGKSTLAHELVARVGPLACHVPMDGFHLADAELARLGRRHRKGAPDTFDAAGYVALLRRLRSHQPAVVYAPTFDRRVEEPVAGAIPVPPEVSLVVTEGNYLLLDEGPWAEVAPLLDQVWFVAGDEDLRRDQLVRRHMASGRSAEEARAWAFGSDQRNADLVARTRHRADLVLTIPPVPSWSPAQGREVGLGATHDGEEGMPGAD